MIRNVQLERGPPAPVANFIAQLHRENGWRPSAISSVGTQGLAQFMPVTADWISQLMPELNSCEPFNPTWTIRAPVNYDHRPWQCVNAASDYEHMATTLSGHSGGLGQTQRDRWFASQKRLDSTRQFDRVATTNAGHNTTSRRENHHYPQRILFTLILRYLSWGGASYVDAQVTIATVAGYYTSHSPGRLPVGNLVTGIQHRPRPGLR